MSNKFLNLVSNLENTSIFSDKWLPLLHFDMEKLKSNAGAKFDPEEHLLNYIVHHHSDHNSCGDTHWLSPHVACCSTVRTEAYLCFLTVVMVAAL